MASVIHVYHLLFISLKNVRSSQKFPSVLCLSHAAITSPLQRHWLQPLSEEATLELKAYLTCIIQLGGVVPH